MIFYDKLHRMGGVLSRKKRLLPTIFIVALLLALFFTPPFQVVPCGVFLTIVSCLVTLLGLMCRYSTIRDNDYGVEQQTAETGIYSAVRFPKYLSTVLIMLGVAIYAGVVWFIFLYIAMVVVLLERMILFEDGVAVKRYGDKYLLWSTKTNAIIPPIRRFTLFIYKGKFLPTAQKESVLILLLVVGYALINFLKNKMLHFEWSLDIFWVGLLVFVTLETVIFNIKRIFLRGK